MKYLPLILSIFCLSCTQSPIVDEEPSRHGSVLSASLGIDTRLHLNDMGEGGIEVTWSNCETHVDRITLFDSQTGQRVSDYIYIGDDGSHSGDFIAEGSVNLIDGESYVAIYPANSASTLEECNSTITLNLPQSEAQGQSMQCRSLKMRADFTFNQTQSPMVHFKHLSALATIEIDGADSAPMSLTLRDGSDPSRIYTIHYEGVGAGEDIITQLAIAENLSTEPRTLIFDMVYSDGTLRRFEVVTTKPYYAGMRYRMAIGGQMEEYGDLIVSSQEDLQAIAEAVNSGVDDFSGRVVVVCDDITLSGDWTPIGGSSRSFKGSFDGAGHTISGLRVRGGGYSALFGSIHSAEIRDVVLEGVDIESSGEFVGAVVASAEYSNIVGCRVLGGTIISTAPSAIVGGVVGYGAAYNSSTVGLSGCSSSARVQSSGDKGEVGGVIGVSYNLMVSRSSSNGAVGGGYQSMVGGVVGRSEGREITMVYSLGEVSGGDRARVGGIVGYSKGDISHSFTLSEVIGGSQSTLGATAGYISGSATSLYYLSSAEQCRYGSKVATVEELNMEVLSGRLNGFTAGSPIETTVPTLY